MEITIQLNEEDLRNIEKTKNRDGYFFKTICSTPGDENSAIGIISLSTHTFIGPDMFAVRDFFQIKLKLGGNLNYEVIKTVGETVYTVALDEIDHTLFGDHVVINTMDGERITIKIVK
jgi:hypothetical protein